MRKILFLLFSLLQFHCFAQNCTLMGTVTGHDNKPMKMAHIFLFNNRDTIAWAQAKPDGSFELAYPENKSYTLLICGVHHSPYYGNIYPVAERTQEVNARLGTFIYSVNSENVTLAGDFNGFSGDNQLRIPIAGSKGKITAEQQMQYGFANVSAGKLIAGISDEYGLNRMPIGGDYYHSIAKKGAQILFDLEQLPPPGLTPEVKFNNSMADELNAVSRMISQKEQQYISQVMKIVSAGSSDFTPIDLTGEYTAIEKQIDNATTAKEKEMLLVQYMALDGIKSKFLAKSKDPGKKISFFTGLPGKKYVIEAVKSIPFHSPLWLVTPEVVIAPLNTYPELLSEIKWFYDELLFQSVDNRQKAAALKALITASYNNKDIATAKNYFGQLRSEYPSSSYVSQLRSAFDIKDEEREIKIAPDFAVPLVSNPKELVTNKTLKGKYYLLDFWSVGCGGCILKMPLMHQVYEKYKGKNFEIVSVALNPTIEMTKHFQSRKFSMPWINVQPEDIYNSQIAKDFYVGYLPRTYLIGPDGKILAQDNELHGETLKQTLKKYLP